MIVTCHMFIFSYSQYDKLCQVIYIYIISFLFWPKHEMRGLVASWLLRLLVCWTSKGRVVFAPQMWSVPRSGLYIMFRNGCQWGRGPWKKCPLNSSWHGNRHVAVLETCCNKVICFYIFFNLCWNLENNKWL